MLKVPLKCVTQWMDWSYRWKAAFDSDCDDSELVTLLDGFYEVMYQARAEFAIVGFDSRGMDNLCINYSREQSLEWKFAVMREAVIILQEFYRATTSGEFAGQYVHRYDDDKICSEFRERIAWYKSELEKAKAEAPAPLVDAEPSSPLSEDGRTITWGGRDFVLTERAAAVVRLLIKCYPRPLHETYLQEEAEFQSPMRTLVQDTKLSELIVRDPRKGMWKLADPEEIPKK